MKEMPKAKREEMHRRATRQTKSKLSRLSDGLYSILHRKSFKSSPRRLKLRPPLRGTFANKWAHAFKQEEIRTRPPTNDHKPGLRAQQPGSCRLLALPRELRECIYDFVFSTGIENGAEVPLIDAEKPLAMAGRTLLQTCRQIHNEGRLTFWIECRRFWQHTHFTASLDRFNSGSSVKAALRRIGGDDLGRIERVTVDLHFDFSSGLCRLALVGGIWWHIWLNLGEPEDDNDTLQVQFIRQQPLRSQGIRKISHRYQERLLAHRYTLHKTSVPVIAESAESVDRAAQVVLAGFVQSRRWQEVFR
ncbi:hypothetical protein TI39_contig390g00011 [Zymoseptoria brevis]|uniref:Uncharacterized protein n=1 Tax=Zymoseptoria brevis TaxID=1047168 RepID=A0A0F4GP08_9PEZI|nr:hypothetical protein TI39_contig390g00011 [Zymoseptoria brevis]